jgi:hypothetical protein
LTWWVEAERSGRTTAGTESPERLAQRESKRRARHRDDGDEARQALADIHLVRGLLDRAEPVAATTAPRHGKSWSEIGTMLHMSRQAAWDRWHDIDAGQPTPA